MSSKMSKFVAAGSYGCVLKPALPCRIKGTSAKTVGKVFSEAHKAFKELEENEIVQALDPEGAFTLKPQYFCSIRSRDVTANHEGAKCPFQFGPDAYQIAYPDGGVDLHEYMKQGGAKSLEAVLPMFVGIMRGLVTMANSEVCHMDIKLRNIMVGKSGARLIDFGLLRRFDELYTRENGIYLAYTYLWYPPEFKLMYMLGNPRSTPLDFRGFQDAFSRNLSTDRGRDLAYMYLRSPDQRRNLRACFDYYLAHPDKARAHADRVDVYSMGMVLMEVVETMAERGMYRSRDYLSRARACVDGMIRFNPRARFSPREALSSFEALVAKASPASRRRYSRST